MKFNEDAAVYVRLKDGGSTLYDPKSGTDFVRDRIYRLAGNPFLTEAARHGALVAMSREDAIRDGYDVSTEEEAEEAVELTEEQKEDAAIKALTVKVLKEDLALAKVEFSTGDKHPALVALYIANKEAIKAAKVAE